MLRVEMISEEGNRKKKKKDTNDGLMPPISFSETATPYYLLTLALNSDQRQDVEQPNPDAASDVLVSYPGSLFSGI